MFTVPASKATEPEHRFEFEVDGRKHSAPLLEFADTETAASFYAATNEADMRLAYCRALADGDDEVEALLLRLKGDQLQALVKAYDEASDIAAGESDASTDS